VFPANTVIPPTWPGRCPLDRQGLE
jgi:hypothetical protein